MVKTCKNHPVLICFLVTNPLTYKSLLVVDHLHWKLLWGAPDSQVSYKAARVFFVCHDYHGKEINWLLKRLRIVHEIWILFWRWSPEMHTVSTCLKVTCHKNSCNFSSRPRAKTSRQRWLAMTQDVVTRKSQLYLNLAFVFHPACNLRKDTKGSNLWTCGRLFAEFLYELRKLTHRTPKLFKLWCKCLKSSCNCQLRVAHVGLHRNAQ